MIYDIRQTTILHYASQGGLCASRAAADADRPHAASACRRPRSTSSPPPVGRREGADFFGNHLTWIELDEPHDTLTVKVAARIAVEAQRRASSRRRRRRGKTCATGVR